MKISIVIPCYNSEKTILSTLSSIQNQTYDDFEVIIVNDGSTDNSRKLIEDFIKNDSRFKLINNTNRGVSKSISLGVKAATGDVIAEIDSDDTANRVLLETISNNIGNYDIIAYGFKKINSKSKVLSEVHLKNKTYDTEDELKALLNNYYFMNNSFSAFQLITVYKWALACKKEIVLQIIDEYERLNYTLYEDYIYISSALAKAKSVKTIDFLGINYLQTKKSHSHSNQKNYLDLLNLRKKMREYINQYVNENGLNIDSFKTMEFDVSKFYFSRFVKNNSFKESKTFFKKLRNDKTYQEQIKSVNTSLESKKRKLYFCFLKHNMFLPIYVAFKLFNF